MCVVNTSKSGTLQCKLRGYLAIVFLAAAPNLNAQQAAGINSINDTAYRRDLITKFFETQASVRYIYQCALDSKGSAIAWCADGEHGQEIYIKAVSGKNDKAIKVTASTGHQACNETEAQWSPDGKEIAFLSDAQTPGQLQLFIADGSTGALLTAKALTGFDGYISHLHWSPDGNYLSVLYVEAASRTPSPMAATGRAVGLIDSAVNNDVQRIAVIERATGRFQQVTPAQLYIFEYDWSPDGKYFVFTAAQPPGDNNWYIAKLYTENIATKDTTLLYKPTLQIAVPRWNDDGKHIAFIEGLMSDQGGNGGDIYMIDAMNDHAAKNLTKDRTSTPSWFAWQPDGNILFTEFVGGSVAISTLNTTTGATKTVWRAAASIRAGNDETSLSVATNKASATIAFIQSSWNKLPEVWCGNFAEQSQLTHLNDAVKKPVLRTENIIWTNEGNKVQGWLLYPQDYDSTKQYPMLVCVHGGPAWISTPTWSAPDFNTTAYTQLGYFVFFPNPRGSHGQGQAFTLANRRDWGFGDLRDITSGIDSIVAKLPVDNHRTGILGWSYGGSIAMFAITQTNRFKASVAGAGACDWKSYYGQNSIDKFMWSYFSALPYHDPAAYEKVSAITYIKNAKTPTLVLVGERDGEAPPPQSFQFWHALKELDVSTQLMVYADEGHSFEKFENMIDVSVRTIEWFNKYLSP